MKTYSTLKQIKVGDLSFVLREGTSDMKAINEVVIKKSYRRKGFTIEQGESWLDIGANCGAFCVWAASQGASVIAFEPDPDNAAIAQINIDNNSLSRKVELKTIGLTAEDDSKVFTLFRNTANGNLWRNSLYKEWRGGESIAVRTEPVGKYWNENWCIKLDAEGVEMPILERYAEQKVRKLVFEWSFDIDPSIERFEKVIKRLRATYSKVMFAGYKAGYRNWQPSWFPACRVVWCS